MALTVPESKVYLGEHVISALTFYAIALENARGRKPSNKELFESMKGFYGENGVDFKSNADLIESIFLLKNDGMIKIEKEIRRPESTQQGVEKGMLEVYSINTGELVTNKKAQS